MQVKQSLGAVSAQVKTFTAKILGYWKAQSIDLPSVLNTDRVFFIKQMIASVYLVSTWLKKQEKTHYLSKN